jgi:hypothetical protein
LPWIVIFEEVSYRIEWRPICAFIDLSMKMRCGGSHASLFTDHLTRFN